MSLWAILPVKPLRQGKTRLSTVLSEDERNLLNLTLLGNTLNVLRQVDVVNRILVVSHDPEVRLVAENFGASVLNEDDPIDLNRAIAQGVALALEGSADWVMVLPADIPLLEARSVQEVTAKIDGRNQMIIVPDRRGDGTNGLLINPPNGLDFQFGAGSFQRHLHLAEANGLRTVVARIPALSLDVDLPEDLEVLRASMLSEQIVNRSSI